MPGTPPRPTQTEYGDLHHVLGFLRALNDPPTETVEISSGDLDPAVDRLENCLRRDGGT